MIDIERQPVENFDINNDALPPAPEPSKLDKAMGIDAGGQYTLDYEQRAQENEARQIAEATAFITANEKPEEQAELAQAEKAAIAEFRVELKATEEDLPEKIPVLRIKDSQLHMPGLAAALIDFKGLLIVESDEGIEIAQPVLRQLVARKYPNVLPGKVYTRVQEIIDPKYYGKT